VLPAIALPAIVRNQGRTGATGAVPDFPHNCSARTSARLLPFTAHAELYRGLRTYPRIAPRQVVIHSKPRLLARASREVVPNFLMYGERPCIVHNKDSPIHCLYNVPFIRSLAVRSTPHDEA
jgi:hypothetical protein